ncbi:hypothetical protein GF354_06250 [Candidatus Peregrinibacteria bacterium]|nr:hypothetical protein [Candidatus Peregrinibacteria bacterium]
MKKRRGPQIPGETSLIKREYKTPSFTDTVPTSIKSFRSKLIDSVSRFKGKVVPVNKTAAEKNQTQEIHSCKESTKKVSNKDLGMETEYGNNSANFLIHLSEFNRRLQRSGEEIEELLMLMTSDVSFQHCCTAGIQEEMVLYLDLNRVLELYKKSFSNTQEGAGLSAKDIKCLGIKFKLQAILKAQLTELHIKDLVRHDLISKKSFVKLLRRGNNLHKVIEQLGRIGIKFTNRDLSGLKKNPVLMRTLKNADLLE